MGNITIQGVLQLGVGILSLFGGAGVQRNYVSGITNIVGALESMFAQPHEVGAATVTSTTATTPTAS
ncbi:hypothetical protein [Candidatus Magnetominusculus dajiuhuensis]|uniref:hypothetical protein n=1 Tax=Candidatus Magnetominusculus dajiuhuensis TaxID=3137712 RepID=UPI003B42F670